jgi:hypothetical protein
LGLVLKIGLWGTIMVSEVFSLGANLVDAIRKAVRVGIPSVVV